MVSVSVRELKNNLSAYLRRLKSGEVILITSHGRPVGQLLPPPASQPDQAALSRLHAHPAVTPGSGEPITGAVRPIRSRRGENLSTVLLERE